MEDTAATSSLDGWFAVLLALVSITAALTASIHAILNKSDNRATVAWVGVIWLAPLLGSLFYLLLGINRIHRRASALRHGLPRVAGETDLAEYQPSRLDPFIPESLRPLSRLANRVASQPLLGGNAVRPLRNGDEAYPAMLAAIESAHLSITLSTYIFNRDDTGREFVDALSRAVARGVAVRVLVDAVGLRYSTPTIRPLLEQARVPNARFMPPRLPWKLPFLNLRSHRKLLVVDGNQGFVGGINIAENNQLRRTPRHPVRDLHFSIEGPVVSELQEVFAEDWLFTTSERLEGATFFPPPSSPGASLARALPDGPDERFDTLRQVISGAISLARSHVRIMTPYFLPDATLQDALATAALRGVQVDVILPEENNLPVVTWACEAQLAHMLRWGVNIWLAPPPFDHSKLLTVDGEWSLIGSANWDPRSLSLNFECNVECYDNWLAGELDAAFDARQEASRALCLDDIAGFSLGRRLRNGVARLLTPYL